MRCADKNFGAKRRINSSISLALSTIEAKVVSRELLGLAKRARKTVKTLLKV